MRPGHASGQPSHVPDIVTSHEDSSLHTLISHHDALLGLRLPV